MTDRTRTTDDPADDSSAQLVRLLAGVAPASTDPSRRALVDAARIERFGRGEVLIPQGGHEEVGLIIDGFVAARRTTPDGRVVVPMVLGSGNFVSPGGLAGPESPYDFVALVPGSAARWTASIVRSLAANDAGLALGMLDAALYRFAELTAQLDSMHYQDARRRVARVLLRYRDLCFGERPAVPRTDLALLVGTSREMTRRVLSRLVADGMIERLGRGGLRLRDADQLDELAGSWTPSTTA